jgi:hypothetical protein
MSGFTLRELEAVPGRASEWCSSATAPRPAPSPDAIRRTMRERLG